MGKARKPEKKRDFHSKQINMPSKKKEVQAGGKKLKQRMKDTSEELDLAPVVAEPTFVSSPIQSKLKQKTKKKSTKKSQNFNMSPFGMNFDSVENVDCGDGNIFTDTTSFFKRGILIPEHCEIQSGIPGYSPELAVNKKLSVEDGHTPNKGNQNFGPDACDAGLNFNLGKEYNTALVKTSSVRYHTLPENKFLLEMESSNDIFIQGQLNVKVLFGSIEILGWTLNDSTNNCATMYSPHGCSLLSLQPLEHCSKKRGKLAYELPTLGLDSSVAQDIVGRLDVTKSLVIVGRAESTLASCLGQHVPNKPLYPQNLGTINEAFGIESKLNCQFKKNNELSKCYAKPQEWDDLAEIIAEEFRDKGSARVMVCGGKAVGKSTLLRFLVNRSIQKNGQVLFLDFDPGQSEFTVPGCVSVLRVKEPLLGPNYTHIQTPERSVYLGHVNMSKCPERYMKSAQHIIDYCHSNPELSNMVWFINTMGFSIGLGVELNSSLIAMVQPTRVVQIESMVAARNFPHALLPEDVLNGRGRWHLSPQHLNYSLVQLQSKAESYESSSTWGLEAKISRSFMLLAYFHQMNESPKISLTDIIPFRMPLAKLKLAMLHEVVLPGDVLSLLNAALVALCEVGEDVNFLEPSDASLPRVLVAPPVCRCLGFGVVRGVDVETRTLFLVTPLSAASLAAVNCLAIGAVSLPHSVYLSAASGLGHIPYVIAGPGQVTSNLIAQRFFYLPKK